VLELATRVGAVQEVLDPGLPRLLLRQRARAVARAHRAEERAGVAAAEVVALAAASVVEDRLAPVRVADRGATRHDLAYGGVPVRSPAGSPRRSADRR